MKRFDTQILFRPEENSLRFLPEGPYPCGNDQLSWVAIQHGVDSTQGSLNVLDLASGNNTSHELDGRPGFAFPTDRANHFVIGMERRIALFDVASGNSETLCGGVDAAVDDTIINDGVVFDGGLIFGAKHLQFSERKAGLYLWRSADRKLIQLRSDQICSNGKAIYRRDGSLLLLDIDSPTKTIVEYELDASAGTLSDARIVIDLRDGDVFPDGMIMTPDEQSVIVAMFNPHDAEFGEARQYRLSDGLLEAVWITEASPQVTCPQLVEHGGRAKLILTTAAENMSDEKVARHPNAGCLFVADTGFEAAANSPCLRLGE